MATIDNTTMKIDRLVSIIMLLLQKERIGAAELAAMFEVSERTIYRDIDVINTAGIPVVSVPGVGGGFEILKQYKIDNKVFSASDLSAILTGLSGLSGVLHGSELISALAKVKSFIPADKAKDIEVKAHQLCIDVSPWVGNRNIQPYLEIIKTALQENKLISFSYINHHGIKTTRTAEPYQLVLKNSRWYVQTFCREKCDFRLFKLSRMTELSLKTETFVPREYQKPQLDFADIAESMQTEITLRIHTSVMDRVLDFCGFDNFSPDGDNYYIVKFPFIDRDYYYDMLLSFGDQCECLAPPQTRAKLQQRIKTLAALYEPQ